MGKAKKSRFELAVSYKIAAIRRSKGLSQDTIAAMLEVSRGFIGQVESPNSPSAYSLDHINRLAAELKCSIHDLLPSLPIKEDDWDK